MSDRREYMRKWKEKNRSKLKSYQLKYLREMQENPDDRRHGTLSGYTYGCRCERCSRAMAEYRVAHKEKVRREKSRETE